jgi:hypothetical protein
VKGPTFGTVKVATLGYNPYDNGYIYVFLYILVCMYVYIYTSTYNWNCTPKYGLASHSHCPSHYSIANVNRGPPKNLILSQKSQLAAPNLSIPKVVTFLWL